MTRRRSSDMPALGALPATPAGFGAVLHLVPVPGPALAPAHWPAAGQAGLAGQGGFIALEGQGGPAHGCLLISGAQEARAGTSWFPKNFIAHAGVPLAGRGRTFIPPSLGRLDRSARPDLPAQVPPPRHPYPTI